MTLQNRFHSDNAYKLAVLKQCKLKPSAFHLFCNLLSADHHNL